LAEGVLANQVSTPALITEDNEQANISIIDRVPIITSTASGPAGSRFSGENVTTTEEVRYKIDPGDPTNDSAPDKLREIGISITVTPTLYRVHDRSYRPRTRWQLIGHWRLLSVSTKRSKKN
jgi:type II secretory pathway component GspD/PulD (secretin)